MGKGSGLGLATVLGIVEQSGGVITCESESGRGTSFRMLLPEARARPRSRQPAAPPEASPPPARGAETVLLVEDDASVRRVTATILKRLGYHVIEASGADEASARAAAFDGPIHALLSDVVMPQMSGRELARRLERSRDGLKVLFMSGYARDTALRNGEAIDEGAFLQKPFGARELAAKLRALLDS
jgi:CheY-like chemotaxis protein